MFFFSIFAFKGYISFFFLFVRSKVHPVPPICRSCFFFFLLFSSSATTQAMSKVAGSYKKTHTLSARRRDAEKVRERAPDRILVICEKVENSPVPDLDKSKFLVPPDATVGGFLVSIRRRITMEAEKALFLFVGDSVPANSTLMSDLYNTYKDEDGFLYVTYSGENTYG